MTAARCPCGHALDSDRACLNGRIYGPCDAARAAVLAGTAFERAMCLMVGGRQAVVDPAVVALGREPTDAERAFVASAVITWDELAMVQASTTEAYQPLLRKPLFEALAEHRSANRGQYPRRQRARVKRRRR